MCSLSVCSLSVLQEGRVIWTPTEAVCLSQRAVASVDAASAECCSEGAAAEQSPPPRSALSKSKPSKHDYYTGLCEDAQDAAQQADAEDGWEQLKPLKGI